MRNLGYVLSLVCGLVMSAADGPARRAGKPNNGGEGRGGVEVRMPAPAMRTEVPAHPFDLILCRPTDRAITLSVLTYADGEGYVTYGPKSADGAKIPPRHFAKGEPVELVMEHLEGGTRYFYRFYWREAGKPEFTATPEYSFTTARPPGTSFTFTIQADPHLDFGIDPQNYEKSLRNAVAAKTDFHIDLGDTFMTDKYRDYHDAAPHYLAERYYFGIVGPMAPVFLVLGNHDGEQVGRGGDDAMAVWSNGMRKKFFPNPVPNDFYRGSSTPHPKAGLLQNYYSWQWGDALFVVLDPFWYSRRAGGRNGPADNWGRTLGRAQYDWLERTLAASSARYKFIFLHHLVGGQTPEGRGGMEASPYFEWGGHELDGSDTFAQHRPGWPMPIHALLVKHHVSAVFHGHDHLYAQQERDGITYQMVPQPGHTRNDNTRSAAEYGYTSGVIAGASGILRVNVTPDQATVEYVRAYPDGAEDRTHQTGSVSHRYSIAPSVLKP